MTLREKSDRACLPSFPDAPAIDRMNDPSIQESTEGDLGALCSVTLGKRERERERVTLGVYR